MQTDNVDLVAARTFARREHGVLIGGEWQSPASRTTIESRDPATGEAIGAVPAGGAADIDRAVQAASEAFPAWSTTSGGQRAKLMWSLADRIMASAGALGMLESLDNGMPLPVAGFAVMGAAESLRYNAGWAGKIGVKRSAYRPLATRPSPCASPLGSSAPSCPGIFRSP
jgi:phenylacetaldehyde dehydrogenase